MQNIFTIDTFDSEFLNQRVAKCWSDKTLESNFFIEEHDFFVKENINLVFCYIPFDVSSSMFLKEHSYYLVSSQVHYRLAQKERASLFENTSFLITENYNYSDQDQFLNDISKELAFMSHYGKDPFIDKNKVINLYNAWIKNTFNGYADKVFTALDDNKNCIGILSLRVMQEEIRIDLLGVHNQFKKHGIASALMNHAYHYAQEQKKSLIVTTQGENIPANRFYQKHNFVLAKFNLIYHKHI